MKLRLKAVQKKNWGLLIFAGIIFTLGLTIITVAIVYWKDFQWISLGLAAIGLPNMYFSYLAIRDNEPAWLLLDLILPG